MAYVSGPHTCKILTNVVVHNMGYMFWFKAGATFADGTFVYDNTNPKVRLTKAGAHVDGRDDGWVSDNVPESLNARG